MRSLLTASIIVLCSCGWSGFVPGQEIKGSSNQDRASIFRPAPRDLSQSLGRARKAIAEERFSDAVSELGKLLSDIDGEDAEFRTQDFFLAAGSQDSGTHTSLKTEARRLLGSMPPKGREWYELQYGAQARASLEQAVAHRDVTMLADTSRRYFHSKAGYEATLLLGRYQLDHGQSLAAALCFKRLMESPAAQEYEPELSMLLATCWYLARMNDKAEVALAGLAQGIGKQRLRVGTKEIETSTIRGDSRWLTEILGQPPALTQGGENEWIMFRGNPARNAASRGELPLVTPNWRVVTANDPIDEKLIETSTKQYMSQGIAAIPALSPLAIGDVVLMRTPEKLLAIDFNTGKRIWPFPWDDATDSDARQASTGPSANKAARTRELAQRVWEDNPHGQLASDGSLVFLLNDLGFAQANNNQFGPRVFIQPGGQPQQNRNLVKSHNQLVALDIRSEGKIQWQVGDVDGQDEIRLAGAFFLGPPLPIMGQLFVLAEFNGEIQLVVLNAKTGRLEWQQQIAHLDNRVIALDTMRRLSGASPSFADGIVICPTGADAIVAVDVGTRTLLWGYQYGSSSAQDTPRAAFRGMVTIPVRSFGSRWLDGSVTIADGRVIITPPESDELHCVDLLTGKIQWPAINRDEHLYVGGVHDGKVVLVGKNKLTLIHMATGKPVWEKSLTMPDGGLVSGRGFFQGSEYYVPTTASEIVRIDLDKGTIAGQIATDGVLGNLISHRDQIISHSPRFLSSYYSIPALRNRVRERLQLNDSDSWALARQAELQMIDGQPLQGLASLRKAHSIEPTDDAIRALLVQTLLDLIRNDFAQHGALAEEVERLIDQPKQRLEFLRVTASGLEAAGQHASAFDAYLRLALWDSQAGSDPAMGSNQREQVSKNLTVRQERWVYSRLRGLYRRASENDRMAMDRTIEEHWLKARTGTSEASLRRFVDYFGFHPLGESARLELARSLLANDDFLEAEQLLARLELSGNRLMAAEAAAELAALFVRARQFELAGQYYNKLRDLYADVPISGGRSVMKIYEQALGGDVANWLNPPQWNDGRVEIADASDGAARFQNYAFNQVVTLLDVRGPVSSGTHIVADTQRTNMVTVRDGRGNELVQANIVRTDGRQFYSNNALPAHQARIHGHLSMVQVGTELFAISALRSLKRNGDAVLWREDLVQAGDSGIAAMRVQNRQQSNPWDDPRYVLTDATGRPIGQLGPFTTSGQIYQRGREIYCVDALDGEVIWVRSDIDVGSDLFGDDDLLFVTAPNSDESLVLDPLDGSELGRRKIVKADARWTTRGRNVLTWTQADGRLVLRLFDAWTGTNLLQRDCAIGSKGFRIGNEEIAVLQPDGVLFIASLDSGELRVSTTVEACTNLAQLRVLRSHDLYHVIANSPLPNAKPNVQVVSQPGASLFLSRAAIYAFERVTGKSVWLVPAIIEQHTLSFDQPAELPALTFFQQLRGNPVQAGLLCIDKRDGRILYQSSEQPGAILSLDIGGDLATQTMTIATQMKVVTLRFTEEPVAPEPPAQTGTASTAAASRRGGFLGTLVRLGKDLFGDAEEPQEDDDPFRDP